MLSWILPITIVLGIPPSSSEVLFVTPTDAVTQPILSSMSYTLDQYAQNVSLLKGHDNVTLVFLEGVHNLSHNFEIDLNISTLKLQGQGMSSYDTTINVQQSVSIVFRRIKHLVQSNIHIQGQIVAFSP